MNINKTLETSFELIGLSEKHLKMYLSLLKFGTATAQELIKSTGLKRGNTYDILYDLESNKLVIKLQSDGKLHFLVEPPERLFDLVSKQKQKVKSAEQNIKAFLPELQSAYQLSVGKPTVRYFEGEKGIRTVFEDIYAPKDEIVYGCVDLEIADKALPNHIVRKLIPKRVKNKLWAYSLIGDSETAREIKKDDENNFRKSLLLDKEKYPMPAEIDVYEDKIAMLTFDKGKFIGIIIQNQSLATTLKSLFKNIFENSSDS